MHSNLLEDLFVALKRNLCLQRERQVDEVVFHRRTVPAQPQVLVVTGDLLKQVFRAGQLALKTSIHTS